MIYFSIIKTLEIGNEECFYEKNEKTLFCTKINYIFPQKEHLLRNNIDHTFNLDEKKLVYIFAGDLEMEFDKENGYFNKFDAYSNMQNWNEKGISFPYAYTPGILMLNWEIETDVDHRVYSHQSNFDYDSIKNILFIKLVKQEADIYFQISKNIICGLSSNLLSCFYLLNIQMI